MSARSLAQWECQAGHTWAVALRGGNTLPAGARVTFCCCPYCHRDAWPVSPTTGTRLPPNVPLPWRATT